MAAGPPARTAAWRTRTPSTASGAARAGTASAAKPYRTSTSGRCAAGSRTGKRTPACARPTPSSRPRPPWWPRARA
eukprot:11140073-Lingulodinium_polyedra.AAC.1